MLIQMRHTWRVSVLRKRPENVVPLLPLSVKKPRVNDHVQKPHEALFPALYHPLVAGLTKRRIPQKRANAFLPGGSVGDTLCVTSLARGKHHS